VLVGALAYSIVGHGAGVSSLDPANDTRIDRGHRRVGATASAAPRSQATPTGVPAGPGSQPVASGPRGTRQPALPSATVSTPATRHPQGPKVRAYAARAAVTRSDQANTSTSCPPTELGWCVSAGVTVSQDARPTYTFTYAVCRSVRASTAYLNFDRKDPLVDFKAVDEAHNDTVWTWSLGQPVKPGTNQVRVDPGNCSIWDVVWNGYDDFGDLPPAGTYHLTATSFANETLPPAQQTFDHV
jgi:hypothetical protein